MPDDSPRLYRLLDFGEGRRLEQFGQLALDRPCPAAEGEAKCHPALWGSAHARFERGQTKQGVWLASAELPKPWKTHYGSLAFELRLTPYGQVGLFPEQATNWTWISEKVSAVANGRQKVRVLNLFAYTGGSTLAAARAGAEVVHVDAAKNIVAWARRNAELSGLADRPIRWLVEDVRKFVKRELKRGSRYEGVVLDPPSYGHGPRGQVWRFSKHLPGLLRACAELSAGRPRFLLLTCHTPGFDPGRLTDMVRAAFGCPEVEDTSAKSLSLFTDCGRPLPSGSAVRWASLE